MENNNKITLDWWTSKIKDKLYTISQVNKNKSILKKIINKLYLRSMALTCKEMKK